MSKTYKNYIGLLDDPFDMYGKAMSIPDNLVIKYFTLATRVPMEEIKRYEKEIQANPKEIKMALASELVRMYHGDRAASEAEAHFTKTFSKKEMPEDVKEIKPSAYDIVSVLVDGKLVGTKSEARRAIDQGGVKIDGKKVVSIETKVTKGSVVQKGKRHFVRVK